eukprot:scaffold55862_cov20-Tisochrysis_lutea.AAC.2
MPLSRALRACVLVLVPLPLFYGCWLHIGSACAFAKAYSPLPGTCICPPRNGGNNFLRDPSTACIDCTAGTRPLAYAAPAAYLAAAAATVATSAIRTWPAPVCTADEAAADIAPLQRVAADAVHAAPLCVAAAAAAAAAAVLPPVAVGCCKSSAAAVVAAYAAAVAAPQH